MVQVTTGPKQNTADTNLENEDEVMIGGMVLPANGKEVTPTMATVVNTESTEALNKEIQTENESSKNETSNMQPNRLKRSASDDVPNTQKVKQHLVDVWDCWNSEEATKARLRSERGAAFEAMAKLKDELNGAKKQNTQLENKLRISLEEVTKLKDELAAEKAKKKNLCIICNKECLMFCGPECLKYVF